MHIKQPHTYHILYLSTIPNFIGGAEFSLFELMRNLKKDFFSPYFITTTEGTFTNALKKNNINYSNYFTSILKILYQLNEIFSNTLEFYF
jgi:hypothetical protein